MSRALGCSRAGKRRRGNKGIVYISERPKETQPIPQGLDWELWLGPALGSRSIRSTCRVRKWYRWWDFGNGTLSDRGSHRNDLPFWALNLKAPLTVEASGPACPHPNERAPASMTATYEVRRSRRPAAGQTDVGIRARTSRRSWTDSLAIPKVVRRLPLHRRQGDAPPPNTPKARAAAGGRTSCRLQGNPEPSIPRVQKSLARNFSGSRRHLQERQQGVGELPSISGRLTEANHLGNVAYRVSKKIEVGRGQAAANNAPEAEKYIRREYRRDRNCKKPDASGSVGL